MSGRKKRGRQRKREKRERKTPEQRMGETDAVKQEQEWLNLLAAM